MNTAASVGEIETYLRERIAKDLELDLEAIQVNTDLSDMGLSSVLISFIEGDVEAWLGVEIPPALLFQTSNIREAAKAIAELQRAASASAKAVEIAVAV